MSDFRAFKLMRSAAAAAAAGMLILAAGGGIVAGTGCDDARQPAAAPTAQTAPPPPPPAKKEWTAEEIAKDPQGYLVWSDRQVQEQIAQREKRLKLLAESQAKADNRRKELQQSLMDVENIHTRMKQAYQRSEDEDRWPVRMAGKSFERSRAREIIVETEKYLHDRRPLLDDYDRAIQKMMETAAVFRKDIASLNQLRERLALDLEQVRIRQGMEEIEQLRKTEAELASMSKTLSTMGNDDLSLPPPPAEGQSTLNVEDLLK